MSEDLEKARQRLKQSLDANPELKKAFKEALVETRKHFENPEVISGMAKTLNLVKEGFQSGKVKEIAQDFKIRHGISGNEKLTDDMKKKLADEIANGILGKK
jgi:ferritin-like metal-binding protein YciE